MQVNILNKYFLILLHPERPKLYEVLTVLSAIGLNRKNLLCRIKLMDRKEHIKLTFS